MFKQKVGGVKYEMLQLSLQSIYLKTMTNIISVMFSITRKLYMYYLYGNQFIVRITNDDFTTDQITSLLELVTFFSLKL